MVQVLPMGVAQDEPVQQRPVHLVEGLWASFFRDLSVLLPYIFRQDQFPVPVELVQPVVLPRLICPAKPVPSSLRRQMAFCRLR